MTIFNYTVNFIDVGIVAVILIAAAACCKRGFVLNVLGFVRWSVGLFLCFFASSHLSEPLYNTYVQPRALESIQQNIATSSNVDEIMNNLSKITTDMPAFLAKMFDTSAIKLSGDDIAASILENVFEPVLITLTKIAVFLAVFIVFFLITGIIILLIKRHNKKKDKDGDSKLRTADKVLGLILGLVKGALIVFAAAAVIQFMIDNAYDSGKTTAFIEYAKNSSLLELIKEINPFNAVTEGII